MKKLILMGVLSFRITMPISRGHVGSVNGLIGENDVIHYAMAFSVTILTLNPTEQL